MSMAVRLLLSSVRDNVMLSMMFLHSVLCMSYGMPIQGLGLSSAIFVAVLPTEVELFSCYMGILCK